MPTYGLDISEHQAHTLRSQAAWDAIKDSKFNDFIILRRGFGVNINEDSSYKDFYWKAKKIGIDDISSYWFSYAINADEAKQEAQNYIDLTNRDGLALNCLIFDLEDNSKFQKYGISLTSAFVNQQIEAFVGTIRQNGLNAAVYASQWVLQDLVDWDLIHDLGCGVWNARYNGVDEVRGWMHQYTDQEWISIFGPFDANVRY